MPERDHHPPYTKPVPPMPRTVPARDSMKRPITPGARPDRMRDGGEDRDEDLGPVAEGNQLEGRQVLGTCSPERLLTRLDQIRADVITGPEVRVAEECIMAVREEWRELNEILAGLLATTVFHCIDHEEFGLSAKHAAAVADALLNRGVTACKSPGDR